MKIKSKVGIIVAVASFLLMLGFQNCAKTQMTASDSTVGSTKVDTNDILAGQEVNVDQIQQNSNSSLGEGDPSDDVGYQIEDREVVRQREMDFVHVAADEVPRQAARAAEGLDVLLRGLRVAAVA